MGKIAEVQEVTLRNLVPYAQNAKIHGAGQIDKLKKSIEEFGFLTPCLIDRDFNIIAGHGRVMAAKELGMQSVPCVFIEGLTEAQRRAYILADNRLGELGEWDMDLVASELQWLSENDVDIDLTGFTIEDQYLDNEPINDNGIGAEIEEMSRRDPITHSGELWQLGEHRLMVGDSTNIDDVYNLVGGVEMDLLETDPPYNVNVSNAAGDTIANDNLKDDEFSDFLYNAFSNAYTVMRAGAPFYIWHADSNGLVFREKCEEVGLHIRQNLIWVKNHFTLGRQDYQWRHEPCLYGWKEGAGHYFTEKRNISTVIESLDDLEDKTKDDLIAFIRTLRDDYTSVFFADVPLADDLHPTMKPIELIIKQIKNSTKEGDCVLDLFGGSGTTLMACERLNRKAYIMEYDPKYADVIIERWESFTNKKATLVEKP